MHQDIDIGALLRTALAQGRSTAQLGKEIGLSQPTVSRLSRGIGRPAKSLTATLRLIHLVGGSVVVPEPAAAQEPARAA